VRNLRFVIFENRIVYIVVTMVVRQSRETVVRHRVVYIVVTMVVRQSRETGCDVLNCMSDRCVRYRMFVAINEFCVIVCILDVVALCTQNWTDCEIGKYVVCYF
jgi:hypothetical protein